MLTKFLLGVYYQMRAHVHMFKMCQWIGSRRGQMPSVSCAHNWGDPCILHHVDTGTEERGIQRRHDSFCWCLQLMLVGVYSNFWLLGCPLPVDPNAFIFWFSLPSCNICFFGFGSTSALIGNRLTNLFWHLMFDWTWQKKKKNCTHHCLYN